MIETALPLVRLGPTDSPVLHSYYDICPESPDGRRAIVSVFESDAIPGPATVAIVARDGEVLGTVGDSAEAIGHVGRFALWLDDDRVAIRHGADEADSDWSIVRLSTGEEVRRPGSLRQWHAGTGRGLVQWLGATPNPHRLRQGIRVVDDSGDKVAEVDVRDCLEIVPEGMPKPPPDELNLMNLKWSPDGSRFFAVFTNELHRRLARSDAPLFKTIVSFDSDACDARFLGSFTHHPIWSPDGSRVFAMQARGDQQDLISLPADGGGEASVVLKSVPGIHGTVTPGGRRLIIDVPERNRTACAIAGIDLADGRREDLVRFSHTRWEHREGNHPHPVPSPDGRRIYFNAQADGRCGCYALEMDANGS
ncbi:MAG: hypothetical protein ACP5HU_11395 [Phycisphaerae bacterium]